MISLHFPFTSWNHVAETLEEPKNVIYIKHEQEIMSQSHKNISISVLKFSLKYNDEELLSDNRIEDRTH
jgi:hypothetical protein